MKDIEKRYSGAINLRVARKEGEPVVLEGYSIIYDSETDIGWYDETVARGAATEAIKKQHVAVLVDHISNEIVGRTGVNAKVTEDAKGVFIRVTEPSVKSARFDQLVADVEAGFITGQSFAFRAKRDRWEYIRDEETDTVREKREILEIKEIYDYSFVTYPAYEDTTVAKRSLEIFKSTANSGENSNTPENRAIDKLIEETELKILERNL